MKKLNNLILFFFVSTFFVSCATENYFITPEYRGKNIPNAALIIPTIEDVKIYQYEGLFDESETDLIKTTYLSLFSKKFVDDLKAYTTFKKITYVNYKTKPEFQTHEYDLNGKEKIELKVPKRPIEISAPGNVFILFLQDLSISIYKEQRETSKPGKNYSVFVTPSNDVQLNTKKLFNHYISFQMKYVIYDNTAAKVVSYGKITEKEKFNPQKEVVDVMNDAIGKFAENIVKDTPFANN